MCVIRLALHTTWKNSKKIAVDIYVHVAEKVLARLILTQLPSLYLNVTMLSQCKARINVAHKRTRTNACCIPSTAIVDVGVSVHSTRGGSRTGGVRGKTYARSTS